MSKLLKRAKAYLKFLIELQGEIYVKTHDIRIHLNHLDDLGVKLPNRTALGTMALILNSWETESRYLDSFFAVMSDINLAMGYAKELIAFADDVLQQNASIIKKLKAFRELHRSSAGTDLRNKEELWKIINSREILPNLAEAPENVFHPIGSYSG